MIGTVEGFSEIVYVTFKGFIQLSIRWLFYNVKNHKDLKHHEEGKCKVTGIRGEGMEGPVEWQRNILGFTLWE